MQKFIGGIGCFWDETKYEGIPGIISTECGYCGGKSANVTYQQVCRGDTEHVEVVKVEGDASKAKSESEQIAIEAEKMKSLKTMEEDEASMK